MSGLDKTKTQKDVTPHGRGVRGITLPRNSVSFEGRFGRMFRALPGAEFGADEKEVLMNLMALAAGMTGKAENPSDGPDDQEGDIPALYTYFGQFIDHDLTFDPASSLQQQNDPDSLVDYRTPRFDLDSVYGRGPEDQPYMYDFSREDRRALFLLGNELKGGVVGEAVDLPRNSTSPARALIGDPRNDENAIISQLHGLFLRFHNRFLNQFSHLNFAEVQREVRFHYQWMVIHDFLPKVVNEVTLDKIFPHIAKQTSIADDTPHCTYYHAKNEAYMPLEFSVAAYRFGHSMVRPGYRLNDGDGSLNPMTDTLLPTFGGKEDEKGDRRDLSGFRQTVSQFGLDFSRFIDIAKRSPDLPEADAAKLPEEERKARHRQRLQFAYQIDTSMVEVLGRLPASVAPPPHSSLAVRNLVRGWRLKLPSGQSIARAIGEQPLTDEQILIHQEVPEGKPFPNVLKVIDDHGGDPTVFVGNCPLWAYVLAEAQIAQRKLNQEGVVINRLGPVGGTIVAETFAGILMEDSQSFVSQDPRWRPKFKGPNGAFGLREFVLYALGESPSGEIDLSGSTEG